MTSAATKAGTTPATVRRYATPALHHQGRQWTVTNGDRLLRRMVVQTPDGRVDVTVRGSHVASRISAHADAIHHYLSTGDTGPLQKFVGTKVGGVELLTDPDAIELEHNRGELALDDIYTHH